MDLLDTQCTRVTIGHYVCEACSEELATGMASIIIGDDGMGDGEPDIIITNTVTRRHIRIGVPEAGRPGSWPAVCAGVDSARKYLFP